MLLPHWALQYVGSLLSLSGLKDPSHLRSRFLEGLGTEAGVRMKTPLCGWYCLCNLGSINKTGLRTNVFPGSVPECKNSKLSSDALMPAFIRLMKAGIKGLPKAWNIYTQEQNLEIHSFSTMPPQSLGF